MLNVGQFKLFIKQQFESRLKGYCELWGVIKDWLFAFKRAAHPLGAWLNLIRATFTLVSPAIVPAPWPYLRGSLK